LLPQKWFAIICILFYFSLIFTFYVKGVKKKKKKASRVGFARDEEEEAENDHEVENSDILQRETESNPYFVNNASVSLSANEQESIDNISQFSKIVLSDENLYNGRFVDGLISFFLNYMKCNII
jgi:hypothetical protein